jgi:hypothetical protein
MAFTKTPVHITIPTDSPNEIWEAKVGWDSANKRMIAKVYQSLYYVLQHSILKPSWVNVVKHMLAMDDRDPKSVCIYGYYGTISRILKDIKVIKYDGRKLVPAENWDRFYSNEDWSWFITNTNSSGYGKIVK